MRSNFMHNPKCSRIQTRYEQIDDPHAPQSLVRTHESLAMPVKSPAPVRRKIPTSPAALPALAARPYSALRSDYAGLYASFIMAVQRAADEILGNKGKEAEYMCRVCDLDDETLMKAVTRARQNPLARIPSVGSHIRTLKIASRTSSGYHPALESYERETRTERDMIAELNSIAETLNTTASAALFRIDYNRAMTKLGRKPYF